MGFVKDFKEFAIKGNVLDLAVAVVIGAAFGKIITSFVNDILMPPIGMLLGGVDFKEFQILLSESQLGPDGEVLTEGASINYGMFIQTTIDFIIIALAIFLLIRVITKLRRKEAKKPEPVDPAPTKQESLLMEIRDLLKVK